MKQLHIFPFTAVVNLLTTKIRTTPRIRGMRIAMAVAVCLIVSANTCLRAQHPSGKTRVLVLSEVSGHHVGYSAAARAFLDSLQRYEPLSIDYIHDTKSIDAAFLNQYKLFIQLDYPPYGWGEKAEQAFVGFMKDKNRGWIGFHHATLLGTFDGYPMWDWFFGFMGGIEFRNYIPTFADAQVNVEDPAHPVMHNVKSPIAIQKEEWYTYNSSPRKNVHVIASVDEKTYRPQSDVTMGDHPVIWSNEQIAARNVYIFMGHGPWLFGNTVYRQIFAISISWTAGSQH